MAPEFSLPSVDQKLFLVISVALATVSFFINAVQLVIFLYHDMLHNVKNMLLLSQAVSGLVTTFTVVYPIKLVTSHPIVPFRQDHNFFNDFAVCYFVASGFLVLSIFSSVTNFTVIVLEQYLCLLVPSLAAKFSSDFMLVTGCITAAWLETVLLAMAPWLGWNEWNDNYCHLPEVWPTPFVALVAFLFFVHLGAIAAMFIKIWLVVRRRSYAVNPDSEELPVTSRYDASVASVASVSSDQSHSHSHSHSPSTYDVKLRFVAYVVLLACHVPVVLHLVSYADCSRDPDDGCAVDTAKKTTAFVWTSLLLVLNAVISPLIYIFTDEHLTKATIWFLKLCCCPVWCKACKVRNTVSPR